MKNIFIIPVFLLAFLSSVRAQWNLVPLPVLTPPSGGTNYVGFYNYILNHQDTIIGSANTRISTNQLLTTYYYSVNRGVTYNVILTRPATLSTMPPIKTSSGSVINGKIYLPSNDFNLWDTVSAAALFFNLKINPIWYRRLGDYITDSIGYYVNNTGVEDLYKSTNLGLTKSIVLDSITNNIDNGLEKIFIMDKNHLWARRFIPSGQVLTSALRSLHRLYRSSDGGVSWTFVPTNLDTFNLPAFNVHDLHFVSPDTGFISASRTNGGIGNMTYNSELYRTTDGGYTWTRLTEIPNPLGSQLALNRIFFINSKIGFTYGVTGGNVKRTIDGGFSWHIQNSLPNSGYREMTFINNIIYVRDVNGALYYTTTMGDATVGVAEQVLRQPLSVSLYPNPAKHGKFTMQWDATTNEDARVAIYDVMGKHVHQQVYKELNAGENKISIELDVAPGVYYVRMQQGAAYASKSVLIGR